MPNRMYIAADEFYKLASRSLFKILNPGVNMAAGKFVPSANSILEVLNLHNYEDWSCRVKIYLESEGLWEVVEATAETPSKEDNADYRDWEKNAKAHHAIQNSCGTDVFGFIRDSRTAKHAWATLAEMFKPVTASNNTDEGSAGLQLKDLKINDVIDQEEIAETSAVNDQQGNIYERFFRDVKDGLFPAGFSCENALEFLKKHPETVRERDPSSGMPALHFALSHHTRVKLVKMMVQSMTDKELEILDPSGRTALSYAVSSVDRLYGAFSNEVAERMVEKNQKLLSIVDPSTNMIPVVMAHARDSNEIDSGVPLKLFKLTPLETMCAHQAAELISICLRKGKFEIPIDLLNSYPSLGITKDLRGQSPLYILADNKGRFFNNGEKRRFWGQWIYNRSRVHRIRESGIHAQVLTVLDHICKVIKYKEVADMQKNSLLKAAIFRAAEIENVEFIRHMFRANNEISRITNGKDRTVLQFAADYRLEKVYKLIYEQYVVVRNICIRKDRFDNNMLHIVGSFPSHAQAIIGHIRGAALQMQREVQWFSEVLKNTPLDCLDDVNQTDQLPPVEVFIKYHKDLMKEGELSMKETATSCTVVGALIVTMMFAAAFTIPGGNNGDTGFPIFSKKKAFKIFIVSDAISLFSSTTSVMVFLGILTSRYKWTDFLKSLPSRMMAGLFTLFLSIATTMIAFSAALYLTLDGNLWIVVPVVLLSSVPIASFGWMQFPFFVEIFNSTYGRSIFAKD